MFIASAPPLLGLLHTQNGLIGTNNYLLNPKDNSAPWLVLMLLLHLAILLSHLLCRIVLVTIVYILAKTIFKQVIGHISNATFLFYDVTPVGRLMNRLTADMQTVDMATFYIRPFVLHGMSWAASLVVIASNILEISAEHLDPVLKGISLRVPGGSTTAIVGRTGRGKSTLAASLLKIVNSDADGGMIKIDNVSFAEVETAALRQRVAFVEQDPVLFSGTIRHNLDPLHDHTGEECATVLDRICAKQGRTLDT